MAVARSRWTKMDMHNLAMLGIHLETCQDYIRRLLYHRGNNHDLRLIEARLKSVERKLIHLPALCDDPNGENDEPELPF